MAVFAPMPSARVSTATAAKALFFASERAPWRKSCQIVCMRSLRSLQGTFSYTGSVCAGSGGRHTATTLISAELVGSDAGFLGFFDDAAVEEVNGALGKVGVALVVCDHADGGAVAVQIAQQLHDRFAVFGVQVSGGLVSHQDERIANQRAGHGDALLLTSGELRRIVAQAMGHADALERILHFLLALAGTGAAIGERELDVFVNGEIAA